MADGSGLKVPREPLTPPMKWAGGKRWLVQRIANVLALPFDRLIEPFAGSAAAFFRLRPERAILADTNAELINVYKCIRRDHERVEQLLRIHASQHNNEYYYRVRESSPSDLFERAARIVYLNRTCWNALYRVNRNGVFNVPRGTKNSVLLATDDFPKISGALKAASLRTADFAKTIQKASENDLIFADPPYLSRTNTGTFVKYTNPVFTWKDQERLAAALIRARARGAHFILTNADCPDLEHLYRRCGYVARVARHSIISGSAEGRKETLELLWTSFPLAL